MSGEKCRQTPSPGMLKKSLSVILSACSVLMSMGSKVARNSRSPLENTNGLWDLDTLGHRGSSFEAPKLGRESFPGM